MVGWNLAGVEDSRVDGHLNSRLLPAWYSYGKWWERGRGMQIMFADWLDVSMRISLHDLYLGQCKKKSLASTLNLM